MSNTLLPSITHRIADPGDFIPRGDNNQEPITQWGARAVAMLFDTVIEERDKIRGQSIDQAKANQLEIADLRSKLKYANAIYSQLEGEVKDLRGWKEQQMQVVAQCDMQKVGELLGLVTGQDVAPAIIPGIERLMREARQARTERNAMMIQRDEARADVVSADEDMNQTLYVISSAIPAIETMLKSEYGNLEVGDDEEWYPALRALVTEPPIVVKTCPICRKPFETTDLSETSCVNCRHF